MAVEVRKEPKCEYPCERCCFCREPTPFWTIKNGVETTGEDVACCPRCAARALPEDVPTKKVWFRRERIVTGR